MGLGVREVSGGLFLMKEKGGGGYRMGGWGRSGRVLIVVAGVS